MIWWKRGARFGIVILNGTRELAIVPSRIRKIILFFWESGSKMYKENQAVNFLNVGNSGTKGCCTFSTTLGPITDLSRGYRERLRGY